MNNFQGYLKLNEHHRDRCAPISIHACKKQSGSALIVVLLLVIVGSLIAISQAKITKTDMKIAHNNQLGVQALGVAEAGIYHAFNLIKNKSTNFDRELNGKKDGDPGTSGVLKDIGNEVDLDGDGIKYRFNSFGGSASDGYFVRAEDNYDEATANDTTDDSDGSIYITSRGRVATAERTIKVRIAKAPPIFGLFGVNEVDLKGATGVDSYNPNDGYDPLTPGNLATVGSDVLVDTGNRAANIDGSVSSGGTIVGNGIVSGTTTMGLPAIAYPPVAACGAPYSDGTGISGGAHDAIELAATGNLVSTGGTVTLASGTYCFNELTMSGGSILSIDASSQVNIYLTGDVDLTGGVVSNNDGNASSLKIYASGTADIKISGGATFYAYIYAPEARVDITGGSDFFGSVIGDRVILSGAATAIHVDEGIIQGGLSFASWREIKN